MSEKREYSVEQRKNLIGFNLIFAGNWVMDNNKHALIISSTSNELYTGKAVMCQLMEGVIVQSLAFAYELYFKGESMYLFMDRYENDTLITEYNLEVSYDVPNNTLTLFNPTTLETHNYLKTLKGQYRI